MKMMNNNGNNSGGGFLNGLILGVILGGGAVFLFGTKKGKKLLKTITEEGLDGIADLEDFIEEVDYKDRPVRKQKTKTIPLAEDEKTDTISHLGSNGELKSKESTVNKVTSTARRFFRGVPKKR